MSERKWWQPVPPREQLQHVEDALEENSELRNRVVEMQGLLQDSVSLELYGYVERDAERYREALERIAAIRVGPEFADTEEEQIAYWSKLALSYRKTASEALNGGAE